MHMNAKNYIFTEYYENGDSCKYTLSADRELSREALRGIAQSIGESHILGVKREKQTKCVDVHHEAGAFILCIDKNRINTR